MSRNATKSSAENTRSKTGVLNRTEPAGIPSYAKRLNIARNAYQSVESNWMDIHGCLAYDILVSAHVKNGIYSRIILSMQAETTALQRMVPADELFNHFKENMLNSPNLSKKDKEVLKSSKSFYEFMVKTGRFPKYELPKLTGYDESELFGWPERFLSNTFWEQCFGVGLRDKYNNCAELNKMLEAYYIAKANTAFALEYYMDAKTQELPGAESMPEVNFSMDPEKAKQELYENLSSSEDKEKQRKALTIMCAIRGQGAASSFIMKQMQYHPFWSELCHFGEETANKDNVYGGYNECDCWSHTVGPYVSISQMDAPLEGRYKYYRNGLEEVDQKEAFNSNGIEQIKIDTREMTRLSKVGDMMNLYKKNIPTVEGTRYLHDKTASQVNVVLFDPTNNTLSPEVMFENYKSGVVDQNTQNIAPSVVAGEVVAYAGIKGAALALGASTPPGWVCLLIGFGAGIAIDATLFDKEIEDYDKVKSQIDLLTNHLTRQTRVSQQTVNALTNKNNIEKLKKALQYSLDHFPEELSEEQKIYKALIQCALHDLETGENTLQIAVKNLVESKGTEIPIDPDGPLRAMGVNIGKLNTAIYDYASVTLQEDMYSKCLLVYENHLAVKNSQTHGKYDYKTTYDKTTKKIRESDPCVSNKKEAFDTTKTDFFDITESNTTMASFRGTVFKKRKVAKLSDETQDFLVSRVKSRAKKDYRILQAAENRVKFLMSGAKITDTSGNDANVYVATYNGKTEDKSLFYEFSFEKFIADGKDVEPKKLSFVDTPIASFPNIPINTYYEFLQTVYNYAAAKDYLPLFNQNREIIALFPQREKRQHIPGIDEIFEAETAICEDILAVLKHARPKEYERIVAGLKASGKWPEEERSANKKQKADIAEKRCCLVLTEFENQRHLNARNLASYSYLVSEEGRKTAHEKIGKKVEKMSTTGLNEKFLKAFYTFAYVDAFQLDDETKKNLLMNPFGFTEEQIQFFETHKKELNGMMKDLQKLVEEKRDTTQKTKDIQKFLKAKLGEQNSLSQTATDITNLSEKSDARRALAQAEVGYDTPMKEGRQNTV